MSAPGVAIETMVKDVGGGIPGVRVGTQTYPASVVDRPRWQVVALSQANLKPKWNRTYSDGDQSVVRDLQSLQNDPVPSTVVVTTFDRPNWVGFDPAVKTVAAVLTQLSLEIAPASVQPSGTKGAFSAVVDINGKQSSPQYRWGAGAGSGDMVGLLVYDQFLDYRYAPNDRPTIDTRSVSTCNIARTTCNVGISVAGVRAPGAPSQETATSDGAAGFLVRVYSKLDLNLLERRTFETGNNAANDEDHAKDMTGFLTGLTAAHPGDLVVITSFRSPGAGHDVLVSKQVTWATMLGLSKGIAAVGGTRNVFDRAAGVATTDYTLVGWTDPTPGLSVEGTGSEASGPDARLRAVLTRNQFSLLRPTNTSSELQPSDELTSVAWAAPSGTWTPLNGDVIAFLQGSQEVKDTNYVLSADPRRQYWNDASLKTGAARDGRAISDLAKAVAKVEGPTDYSSYRFTRQQFLQTRDQLNQEMVLVSHVRANLNNLALPLDGVKGDYQNRINTVVNQIYSDAKAQDQAKFDWTGLFGALVGIVGALGPGVLVKVFGVTVETAQKLATALSAMASVVQGSAWGAAQAQSGPPAYDTFSLKRDEIAAYIGNTTDAAIANLSIMGDLIVADPTKLAQVGGWCFTTAKPDGVCGARDQKWVDLATGALKRSNDRSVYTQMSPLAYASYDLGPTYWPLVEPNGYLDEYYCLSRASFSEALSDAVAVLRQGDYVPHYYQFSEPRDPAPEGQPWTLWPTEQVFVMGLKQSHSPAYSGEAYPTKDVLSRMFGPVLVDANPDHGGLGIPKETFIPALPANSLYSCGWAEQYGGGHTPQIAPGS